MIKSILFFATEFYLLKVRDNLPDRKDNRLSEDLRFIFLDAIASQQMGMSERKKERKENLTYK